MSPEDRRRIKIVEASSRGAPIESRGTWENATWILNTNPQWKWDRFDYRVKEGYETQTKVMGFGTDSRGLSHVKGVWSVDALTSNAPHMPDPDIYIHQADIFVTIDVHTKRVVSVSFKIRD